MKYSALLILFFAWLVAAGRVEDPLVGAVTACPALQTQLHALRNDVAHPVSFCKYYVRILRTRSPVPGVDAKKLVKACQCLLKQNGITVPKQKQPDESEPTTSSAPLVCVDEYKVAIRAEFKQPKPFCRFFGALPRPISPVPGLTAKQVVQGCKCILNPSSTGRTSTPASSDASSTTSRPSPSSTQSTATPARSGALTTEISRTAGAVSSAAPALTSDLNGCRYVDDVTATVSNTQAATTGTATFMSFVQRYGSVLSGSVPITATSLAGAIPTLAAITSCASIQAAAQNPDDVFEGQILMNVYTDLSANTWGCIAFANTDPEPRTIQITSSEGVGCGYIFSETNFMTATA
ncbi:hypothetical protein CAC42_3434 [Sphaceloma murrayae]|uniref:Uncharacterized protein n=1 Tax=Sphaceloma murrayae TaxID=2082308 RepID=A0A2K1R1D1_9PEZI|nr:hypothetical protein CAC42_3434 [Sphaceloma murrayae]